MSTAIDETFSILLLSVPASVHRQDELSGGHPTV
jgi:hypothetical protein